jgi:hypothetical protein
MVDTYTYIYILYVHIILYVRVCVCIYRLMSLLSPRKREPVRVVRESEREVCVGLV